MTISILQKDMCVKHAIWLFRTIFNLKGTCPQFIKMNDISVISARKAIVKKDFCQIILKKNIKINSAALSLMTKMHFLEVDCVECNRSLKMCTYLPLQNLDNEEKKS